MDERFTTPKRITLVPDPTGSPSIPWWKSTQIVSAITGIAAAVVTFCHAFHINLPFSQDELSIGLSSAVTIAALVYWIWKRVAVGNDPASPAAPVTLTKP